MATKVFTKTFEHNVKQLFLASSGNERQKLRAFKHFVNEFGTHYAATTELGTKAATQTSP